MDSEDDTKDDVDSGNESSGDDVDFAMDVGVSARERQTELEDYRYEVLSTEEIVQHMVDCIKEVNTVVEVSASGIPATTTRILLNHFKWDKEKLMERFYDGDQDQLFAEARVINPFRKPVVQRSKVSRRISTAGTEECEICYSVLPPSGQTIACAAHACEILVDDATVMRLVRDPRVKLKYQHIITNSFVEVDTAAHGHMQRQRSHQCIAALLSRNWISDEGEMG
ncbi:Potential E3 ubiquitin-protein ligase ariadne-1 [Eumeta japonica]|uniref:Potential E3 ubiquitin-protein ligase ariadne-1 n=1 Tax=Eumeta variegata TaxID=151549 RepID=A0A4C1SZW1_EUMVA|nr:Potential E3 ubiquitin-protein ligase ariadne-1 [Eumeta japonica]